MAEQNSQDRNLPASERKLKKAREDGQLPRSRDLGHFAAIATGAALVAAAAPQAADMIKQMLMQSLRFDRSVLLSEATMGQRLFNLVVGALWVLVPFGAAMMVAAIAGGLAIGGWNWTFKPLMPNFGKLNPLTGLMGLFKKDKLIDALKGSALALVLGAIGSTFLKLHFESFSGVLGLPLQAALTQAIDAIVGGIGYLLMALAAFALIDAPLQHRNHAQRMKMSHQELKQEQKELEGNQENKARLRSRAREIAKRHMLTAVPKADLVVVNPTHYAVALKYDDAEMGAPRVVAKGADLFAMRIRDLAKDSKVPVLESPVLARALYAHAELDREIPAALFAAVAQVLAYVYQLRAAVAGNSPMPPGVPEVSVPAELDPHHQPVPDMEIYD